MKRNHFLILLLLPLIAVVLSFSLNTNTMGSIVFFLLIPSLYLSILLPGSIKKALLFSLATSIPLIVMVDYIMDVTRQWLVVDTIFPSRFLGFITYETIIWAFFSVYLVVMFYEYFFESHHEKKAWQPRMKILLAVLLFLLAVFLLIQRFNPALIATIPYAYLLVGLITVFIPTIVELFRKPRLLHKFILVGTYFFYADLAYEITALKLGWWTFPSHQYLGMISFLGVSFPIEEFLFWMVFLAVGTLAYYEPFDDDEK